ncbi:MAG: sensor histidine kinase [Planctomycetota bacterium]|jgi:signal transduction histidine kinase
MSLRWQIALPFAALIAALFVVVTYVAADQVSRTVERRLTTQAEKLAKLLARSPGFEASPSLLGYIQEAFGADVAIERGGEIGERAVTVADMREPLSRLLGEGAVRREAGVLQPVAGPAGRSYLAAYAEIEEGKGLLLLHRPEVVESEKAKARGPILTVGGLGLVLAIVLGYAVARMIAGPMERLADKALEVSQGKLDVVIPPVRGSVEINRLMAAFRDMLGGLRRYQEDLIKSERLAVLGQMAAGVAHEIRNPLSSMKMTVQMLREEAPADRREPYDVILREIERLDLAVSELFSAAHPSRLRKEPVALSKLAGEVLALLQAQLDHLSVTVERKMESDSAVEADPNVFKRALMNIVLNGAQSMPQGGALMVGTSEADGRVRFWVRDGGPGVPGASRERMFEPFFTTKEGGVGLGLAVTKRIVEDHGGSVGFETSDDGATFWIELPRHGKA